MNVTASGNSTLFGLSDGIHTLTIHANDTAGNMGRSVTRYFTIDTASPNIEILSPENKTYDTSSVSLSYTVDEETSWTGYSLDGQANVTVVGTTTIPDLTNGPHELIVYAKDSAGNAGISEVVHFNVEIQPKPFQITTEWFLIALAGTVAILGTAVYVIYKKRRTAIEATSRSTIYLEDTVLAS